MYNRTKRTSDTVLEAHWMSRLRELERRDLLEQDSEDVEDDDSEGVEYGESDHNRTAGEVEVEEVWEDVGDPEFLEFSVLKPASNTSCEMISCVSSAGSRDVACLDMRMVNMSAGAFSATARLVPLQKSKSVFAVVCFSLIKEHFNLQWMPWRLGVSEEHFYVFVLIFFNLPQPQTENYQRVIMFKLLDKLSNIFVLFVWCNKAAVLLIPTVFNQINSFLIAGIISAQTFYIPIARERHVSSDNVNKFDTVPLCRAFQRPLESKLDKRGRKSSEGV